MSSPYQPLNAEIPWDAVRFELKQLEHQEEDRESPGADIRSAARWDAFDLLRGAGGTHATIGRITPALCLLADASQGPLRDTDHTDQAAALGEVLDVIVLATSEGIHDPKDPDAWLSIALETFRIHRALRYQSN